MAQNWPGTLLDDEEQIGPHSGRSLAPGTAAPPVPTADQIASEQFPGAPQGDPQQDASGQPPHELPYDPLGQGDIGFASGDTMVRDTPPGNDEYTHNITHGILTGQITSTQQLIAEAAKYGVPAGSWDAERIAQADKTFDAIKHGATLGSVGGLEYAAPDVNKIREKDTLPEGADAFARGAVPFGLGDELGAAVDTVRQGGSYSENLHKNRAVRDYDEEHNWGPRLAGEIVGALALPSGVAHEADSAARLAIREGIAAGLDKAAIRKLATSTARRAATVRMTQEGAGYGAAYGAGSSDGNVGDRLLGAGGGAAAGATANAAMGALGTKLVKLLPRPTAKVDYRSLANDLDIPRTPATAGGPLQEAAQVGLRSLPGSASAVNKAVDRENEALGSALTRTAESVGQVSTRQGAGEAISEGATAYEKAARKTASDLYTTRDKLFGGTDAPVVMMNAAKVGRDIQAKFPNSAAFEQLSEHPAVRKILGGIPDDGEVTLGEATEALSHIRSVQRGLEAKKEASGPILARVKALKRSIEGDVMEAAKAADQVNRRAPGPGSAVHAQKEADAFYRDMSSALKGGLKVAKASAEDSVTVSPDKVFNQLAADTKRVGGNLARLRDTWFRLPERARQTFAATHLAEMGRAKPGAQTSEGDAFSFNTFLTNFDNMTPQARRIMYGKDAEKQIKDIATYSSRLRQIDRLRNFSNTANSLITTGLLGTVGLALFKGDVGTAAEALGAAGSAYGSAKLFLASPAMRDWTTNALKVATISNHAVQQKAAKPLIAKLAVIAKENPPLAADALALQRRLTDMFSGSTPARVAADESGDGALGVPEGNSQNSQDYPGEELPQ